MYVLSSVYISTVLLLQTLEKADNPEQFHVYLMAGKCDPTEKVRDLAWVRDYRGHMIHAKYQKVVFTKSWKHAPTNFMYNLNQLIDELIELQAKPCVMTIPTISLQVWNETRLHQYKTCHLLHHQQYPDMQENLDKSIWEINRLIIEKNIAMTKPVPLGFLINKFPLWDGAGLWPIKVNQACPTGLLFLSFCV